MRSPVFLYDPPPYILADVLPMAYSEDEHDLPLHFENSAVISPPEFPVPSQMVPQGKPVLLWRRHQAGLDRPPDALLHFHVDQGEIDLFDVGVILDRKRHAIPIGPCGGVPGNVSGFSPAPRQGGQDRCPPGSRSLP